MRTVGFYSWISLCLVAWYMVVLIGVLNPNVPLEYRLYYLERRLTDWPGYGGLKYYWGDVLTYGTRQDGGKKAKNRGFGWSAAEEWGTWTVGGSAELFFTFERIPDTNLKMDIRASGYSPGGWVNVDIFGNDHFLASISVEHMNPREYSVPIPARLVSPNPFRLRFLIHNPSSPAMHGLSADKRLLGLGVHWVRMAPYDEWALSSGDI